MDKWGYNYLIELKTSWEKEKLLVTSNFSFSHNVFKNCLWLMHQNEYLWSKGLMKTKEGYELNTLSFLIRNKISSAPIILAPLIEAMSDALYSCYMTKGNKISFHSNTTVNKVQTFDNCKKNSEDGIFYILH